MKNETAHSVSSLPRHSHPAGGAGSGLTSTLAGLVVESSSTTTAGSSPQQQQRRRSSPHSSSHRSSLCSSGSIVDEEEEMNVGATVVTQTHEAARSAKRSSKEQKVSPSSSSSSMEDVDRGVAPDDVSVLHTKTVRSQTKNRPQSVHTSPPTATVSQRSERGAESRRQDPYDFQSGPFSSSQELPHEFSQLRPSNSHPPLPPAASQLMPPPPPPAPAQQHVMRHSPKVSRAATTTLAPPISEADEFQASLEQYQFPARGSAGKNTQDGDYEVKEEEEEDASELDAEEGDHQLQEEDGDDVGGPVPSSSSSYLEGSMAHDDCCFGQEDHRNRGTPTYTTVQGVYSHWASAPAVVATAEQGSPPTSAALEAQPSGQTRVLSALAGRSTCSSTTAREELELERLRTPSTVSAAYSSGTRSSTATASSTATTEGQRKESSEEDDCLITFHATDGATNRRLRKKILGEEGTLSTAGSPTASPGLGSDGSRQTAKPPPAILPSTCGPVGGRLNSPGQGSNASSGGIPNIYSPQSEGDVRSPLSTSESPCRASFFLSGLPTARSFASLSSSFASPRRGATTTPGGGEETDGEQENVDLAKSASFIIPVNRFPDQGQ